MRSMTGSLHRKEADVRPSLHRLWLPAAFVLTWSSGAIFVKEGLRYAAPFQFLAYRAVFSALLLWAVLWILRGSRLEEVALKRNSAAALLLQVGYQTAFFLALMHAVKPGLLAIVLALQPILTGVIEAQRTKGLDWIGLTLGLAGVVVTVGSIGDGGVGIGAAWALLALVSLTAGTVLQHRWSGSGNLPLDMAVQYSISAVVLIAVSLVTDDGGTVWSWPFITSLAWMVVVVSIGATFLLYFMLKKKDVLSVSVLFYCVPPVTALFDYLVYGERLSSIQLGGMGMVVCGLALTLRAVQPIETR